MKRLKQFLLTLADSEIDLINRVLKLSTQQKEAVADTILKRKSLGMPKPELVKLKQSLVEIMNPDFEAVALSIVSSPEKIKPSPFQQVHYEHRDPHHFAYPCQQLKLFLESLTPLDIKLMKTATYANIKPTLDFIFECRKIKDDQCLRDILSTVFGPNFEADSQTLV
jgi:hypothetical protein